MRAQYQLALVSTLLLSACGSATPLNPERSSSFGNPSSPGQCVGDVVQQDPSGWLLRTPEMHFDLWGGAYESGYLYDWYELLNLGTVAQRLAEYGIHGGAIEIPVYSNDGPASPAGGTGAGPSLIDDSVIAAELNKEIQQGSLPFPNDNTLYVVLLPPGVFTKQLIAKGWGGYHDFSSYDGQRYTYAIIQPDDRDSTNVRISHEMYEAATNPDGHGFWDRATGAEVGDLCDGVRTTVDGITVQKVWSQAACECL